MQNLKDAFCLSPPSGHHSGGTWISQRDTGVGTGSTGADQPGARGDAEYASDTASDDNTEAETEHSTEEGENISEVTCDNTIEEAVTPDRHFLDSDTSNEWRQEDTFGEDKESEEDNEEGTDNETNESHDPSSQMDDVSSVWNDNVEAFKEEKIEEKSGSCHHNKDQIMTEVSTTETDDIGNMILIKYKVNMNKILIN